MRGYSNKEIEILKSNPNVITVKYGYKIEYKNEFKKWAVMISLRYPELSAMQIFSRAGFDNRIVTSQKARMRINHWKKIYLKNQNNKKETINDDLAIKNNEILINLYYQFSKLIDIIERRDALDER